ncbi:EF-hand domain-containing protein [Spirillospora sp. NPDC048911]|uniref:EF-hand domain-containing protein n=1 Tax=Spirillospora sp. NPDC048911 TaxID=3364527 RepID=UPI0037112507
MEAQQQERLRARFDQFDANGNGSIEAGDFDLVAARLLREFGQSESSEKGRAVVASHRSYWEQLAEQLDTNRDGRISFEEFCRGVGRPELFDRVVRPYAQAIVAIADRDDDGYVQHDDFVACLRALGFARERIEAVHSSLSTEDGRVGAGAWVEFIAGFYTAGSGHPAQALVAG